ncbi:hypothetical protein [Actinomyces procaprae]|uniref:hypothetical protein n=1 Tax=Actinomyces procaprae TaxID=2560010 RepID=UPI0010A2A461|nr:hypothetical protein [Actinomyces procaprae]
MTTPTLPAAAARRALARAVIVRPGDVTGGEIQRLFGPGADLEVRRAPLCYLGDAGRLGRTYCDAATVHLQAGRAAVVEVAYHLPTALLEWVAAGALNRPGFDGGGERTEGSLPEVLPVEVSRGVVRAGNPDGVCRAPPGPDRHGERTWRIPEELDVYPGALRTWGTGGRDRRRRQPGNHHI